MNLNCKNNVKNMPMKINVPTRNGEKVTNLTAMLWMLKCENSL